LIFVTVGTQKFPFDRLLIELDRLVYNQSITDTVIAQRGYSTYIPQNYHSFDFLPAEEFADYYDRSNILITHSGTSSIIEGLKRLKKVIVVPRQKKYGEHVDNHQLEITNTFVEQSLVAAVIEINHLGNTIQSIEKYAFMPYSFGSETLVKSVAHYLSEIDMKNKEGLTRLQR